MEPCVSIHLFIVSCLIFPFFSVNDNFFLIFFSRFKGGVSGAVCVCARARVCTRVRVRILEWVKECECVWGMVPSLWKKRKLYDFFPF